MAATLRALLVLPAKGWPGAGRGLLREIVVMERGVVWLVGRLIAEMTVCVGGIKVTLSRPLAV